jgi:hypothetical protein
MKLTITSMSGATHKMEFWDKQSVEDFIKVYRSRLNENQRVKVTCDILGIDGYIQGTLKTN